MIITDEYDFIWRDWQKFLRKTNFWKIIIFFIVLNESPFFFSVIQSISFLTPLSQVDSYSVFRFKYFYCYNRYLIIDIGIINWNNRTDARYICYLLIYFKIVGNSLPIKKTRYKDKINFCFFLPFFIAYIISSLIIIIIIICTYQRITIINCDDDDDNN